MSWLFGSSSGKPISLLRYPGLPALPLVNALQLANGLTSGSAEKTPIPVATEAPAEKPKVRSPRRHDNYRAETNIAIAVLRMQN